LAENKKPSWSVIKGKLTPIDKAGLIGLVKDLYDASPENRTFLASRFLALEDDGAALEVYRQQIIVHFFPKRGYGDRNLREARKAITQYKRARGDVRGTVELMLTYVEAGTRFTNSYGDIDEAFYNSLLSVLADLTKMLKTPAGMKQYPHFAARLDKLRRDARDIGWGYGDDVVEEIKELEDYAAIHQVAE
jgi:hypothetical protein